MQMQEAKPPSQLTLWSHQGVSRLGSRHPAQAERHGHAFQSAYRREAILAPERLCEALRIPFKLADVRFKEKQWHI